MDTTKSKIQHEIRVTFANQFLRDEFASKGRLLADHVDEAGFSTASFRLDVPNYLARDFKVLNDYGYQMRCVHGKLTRRYVKYDDENLRLILELKFPGAGCYLKIRAKLARSLIAEGERVEINCCRDELLARHDTSTIERNLQLLSGAPPSSAASEDSSSTWAPNPDTIRAPYEEHDPASKNYRQELKTEDDLIINYIIT